MGNYVYGKDTLLQSLTHLTIFGGTEFVTVRKEFFQSITSEISTEYCARTQSIPGMKLKTEYIIIVSDGYMKMM